ncbi:hypothetical protein GCM10027440_45410 [Nocardiopsis coralliicola]
MLMLDGILPATAGCSHEMAFTPGRITDVCADPDARWGEGPPGADRGAGNAGTVA